MNPGDKDPCELAEIVYEKPLAGAFKELSFGSDKGNTLWVKFSDRYGVDEWIGKFGTGYNGSNYVEKVGEPDQFFISAGGFGYLVDASQRRLLIHHFDETACGIAYDPISQQFIIVGYTCIHLVKDGQVVWKSKAFALDGIWDVRVKERIVTGRATTNYEGETTPFAFDMDTLKIKLDQPWYKFW